MSERAKLVYTNGEERYTEYGGGRYVYVAVFPKTATANDFLNLNYHYMPDHKIRFKLDHIDAGGMPVYLEEVV